MEKEEEEEKDEEEEEEERKRGRRNSNFSVKWSGRLVKSHGLTLFPRGTLGHCSLGHCSSGHCSPGHCSLSRLLPTVTSSQKEEVEE